MQDASESHAPYRNVLAQITRDLAIPAGRWSGLTVSGEENLPSCFPVTDLAVASIGAAALAAAELSSPSAAPRFVRVNRRLASAWFQWSIKPINWSLPSPWDAIAGDYRASDGWIKLHTNAPNHRLAALSILRCAEDKAAVADAVSRRGAQTLESEIIAAGGCAAAMRSAQHWRAHPQGMALAAEPLIAVSWSEAEKEFPWRPRADRPLAGIRVLDLTRVLAGPVATRFLAGLGADVLRIDPPSWNEPGVIPEVTLGKRCARLDLTSAADRAIFESLLARANILVHGYRAGALDGLGYGQVQRRAINADLIDVSLNAYGWTGPWAGRRGFDSLVQMACGIAHAGSQWQSKDQPVPLPVQALDQATGYLMAAAAITGLIARLRDRTILTARLSLARTALALMSCGDAPEEARFTGPAEADYCAEIEQTAWGPARRLAVPVSIEGCAMRWESGATALGSALPAWL